MQLAQLNIAQWKVDPAGPAGLKFVALLDTVNNAAERMPGFVWRYAEADAADPSTAGPFDDGTMIVNMSVWDTPAHLEDFVWNTVHKRVYARKDEWFAALGSQHFVMWWVEDGHVPTLEEAKARLDHLNEHGDSDHAFGWSHLPHIKLWQQARCA